jgi:hypothetical protein
MKSIVLLTPTRSKSRPERHFADSFITIRLVIARAIARWLPRCPLCHRTRTGPAHAHGPGDLSLRPKSEPSQ